VPARSSTSTSCDERRTAHSPPIPSTGSLRRSAARMLRSPDGARWSIGDRDAKRPTSMIRIMPMTARCANSTNPVRPAQRARLSAQNDAVPQAWRTRTLKKCRLRWPTVSDALTRKPGISTPVWDRGALRLSVGDHGSAQTGQPPAPKLHGRGLTVLAGLSRAFGVLPAAGGGGVVWAVLEAPMPSPSAGKHMSNVGPGQVKAPASPKRFEPRWTSKSTCIPRLCPWSPGDGGDGTLCHCRPSTQPTTNGFLQ